MRTLGLLWEWSHTFGGHSPIRAEFVRSSANTRLKALAGEAFRGPGWYGDGRLYVEALDASDDPHLRVSVFERDPRPRMLELCADSLPDVRNPFRVEFGRRTADALALAVEAGSEEPSLLLGQKRMIDPQHEARVEEMRKNAAAVNRMLATRATNYRVEMTTAHHAAAALALAVNAGIPGAMRCYPTALGYEVYCKVNHDGLLLEYALSDVEHVCRQIPGFLGVRQDERRGINMYITAVVVCQHPGRERA